MAISPAAMARMLRDALTDMEAGYPGAASIQIAAVATELEESWPAEQGPDYDDQVTEDL